MKNEIKIVNARENNLKNVSLEFPKHKLIVMSGLSGSGKTTLAFDTLYAEGQRRYMESLSSYARQFLGNFEKPDVDRIENLSPSIAIDQKTTSNNPRSTVGTVTEIYDYLRLLYARVGDIYCPHHHCLISSQTFNQIADKISSYPLNSRVMIMVPLVREKKGSHHDLINKLIADGFLRGEVDGTIGFLEEFVLDKNKRHNINIIVDRLIINTDFRRRLLDSLEVANKLNDGLMLIDINGERFSVSTKASCVECGFNVAHLEPRLFSFNAPLGACHDCRGLGFKKSVDIRLLIPDESLSIAEGAILYFKNTVNTLNLEWQVFAKLLEHYKININIPFEKLSAHDKKIVYYGSLEPIAYKVTSRGGSSYEKYEHIEGVVTLINRRYQETQSEFYKEWVSGFMSEQVCTTCLGKRLNEQALSVYVGGLNIIEACDLPISKLKLHLETLNLTIEKKKIVNLLLKEIIDRVTFLNNVGLGYLNLNRLASTLSGGEAQRIRLANQLGAQLTGVLYVLDEPSIGLHQSDNAKLISALKQMRDLGNTVVVVEHDEETMLEADWLIDIGPGAGINGGEVVYNGPLKDINKADRKNSYTLKYLLKELTVPIYPSNINRKKEYLKIKNADINNLKMINVDIPLHEFVVVSGVSGSGKSSLVLDLLAKELAFCLKHKHTIKSKYLKGQEKIDKLIIIDQSPIGKTPRSNPATYTGVFDLIRDLFAKTVDAKLYGFDKGRFSFNVSGGRCEACQGDGVKKVSMHFLPDVYVVCEQCHGSRYNEQTLAVRYNGKNIYDVLTMSVNEALVFFEAIPTICHRLQTLVDVGLGYITLGQSSTTLSGGEAQRIKLAYELQKKATGKTLFILDEPTTGLHTHDVDQLIRVFRRIVDNGDSVLIIEHNLDVIKNADTIIDLGPDGGDFGGEVVCSGSVSDVVKNPNSKTGRYLAKII